MAFSSDIVGHLQGSRRPLPRKLRKMSAKWSPGLLGPRVNMPEKSRKRVDNEPRTPPPQKLAKNVMFDSFSSLFLTPRPRDFENPFSDFVFEFPRKRPFDPCKMANDIPSLFLSCEHQTAPERWTSHVGGTQFAVVAWQGGCGATLQLMPRESLRSPKVREEKSMVMKK